MASVSFPPIADISWVANQTPMTELHFRFEREDEWHGKLVASVATDGFAGEGGAWFNTDELRAFAVSLSAFPLPTESPPSIAGGFGVSASGPEQVHLAVTVEPHNARGLVRATVRLAMEVWNSEADDLACCTTVRFVVTYADVGQFGPALLAVIDGRAEKATLQSSADR